jgi:hypothetical protein
MLDHMDSFDRWRLLAAFAALALLSFGPRHFLLPAPIHSRLRVQSRTKHQTATQKYVRILHVELIQLYDIQHDLRSLPYLDVFGRLRLTLRLARCTLALPCVVDAVMVREAEQEEREREREQERQQEKERQRLAREATNGRTKKRRRPQGVAGAEGGDAGEEDDVLGRGFDATAGESRKRRPRVRTASTSGPYDDAPFPCADDDDVPESSKRKRGGLLHPKVNSMIMSMCGVLEYGERMV